MSNQKMKRKHQQQQIVNICKSTYKHYWTVLFWMQTVLKFKHFEIFGIFDFFLHLLFLE